MLSSSQFRVLDLLPPERPGDEHSPIRGQTKICHKDDDIHYETLSYVWGDGREKTSIVVDGQDILVTTDLAAALRRLRHPNTTRTVWIDQICINQDDDAEKSVQVPLMGHIYTKTKRSLIWLGEVNACLCQADAASILDLLRAMAKYENMTPPDNCTDIPELGLAERTPGQVHALQSMTRGRNKWWNRMWTLQEAILPSKSQVIWGPLTIDWDVLVAACHQLVRVGLPPVIQCPALWKAANELVSSVVGIEISRGQMETPLYTIFRWGERKATNSLDRVYGMLGVFAPGTLPRSSRCDYKLEAADVFARFTMDLVESQATFHPLALWSRKHTDQRTPNISSWSLDMAFISGQPIVDMFPVDDFDGHDLSWFLMNSYECYGASKDMCIDWRNLNMDENTKQLSLSAWKLDTVHSVSDPVLWQREQGISAVPKWTMITAIRQWYKLADDFYRTTQTVRSQRQSQWPSSFWRGLIANHPCDGDMVPERAATASDLVSVQEYIEAEKPSELRAEIYATVSQRTMLITRTGWLGFGPQHVLPGDEIWIFEGGKVPFVLRPLDGQGEACKRFVLVGSAFVDGVMYGETVGRYTSSVVTLV